MSLTCYNCGESVSPDGNVCVLCGADKDISTHVEGAKMMRNIIALVAGFGSTLLAQHMGVGLVVGGAALYWSNCYLQSALNKRFPDKLIRLW